MYTNSKLPCVHDGFRSWPIADLSEIGIAQCCTFLQYAYIYYLHIFALFDWMEQFPLAIIHLLIKYICSFWLNGAFSIAHNDKNSQNYSLHRSLQFMAVTSCMFCAGVLCSGNCRLIGCRLPLDWLMIKAGLVLRQGIYSKMGYILM